MPVDSVSLFRVIFKLVEPAPAAVWAAIAGTGGAVAPGAAEGRILRAVQSAESVERALSVGGAFQRQRAFLHKDAVSLDLLADGGFVLAAGLCDGGLGRAMGDAIEDDAALLQCQMGIGIRMFHRVTSIQGGICP